MPPAEVQSNLAFGQAGFAGFRLNWKNQFSVEHFQRTATEHSQGAVGWHAANGFVVIKVVAKLRHVGVVFVFACSDFATEQAFGPQPFAQVLNQCGVFGPTFAQQVAHTIQNGGDSGEVGPFNLACGQDERFGFHIGVERGVGKQFVGQRLQACFFGNHALGAALGLERQVNVFQFLFGRRSFDGSQQFRRELALLLNALDHSSTAVL